jgi:predicted O-linked N-acetylglucosamine transferase (SPINDLY family)
MDLHASIEHAHSLSRAGRWDEAIAAYHRALELDPRALPALGGLGDALRMSGRLGEAVDAYLRANAVAPTSVAVLNNLAITYKAAGDLPRALAAFQQAALRAPDMPEPLSNLANLFRDMGDLDRAERCMRRALALQPQGAGYWNNLAGTLERQGRVREALEGYQRAIALEPGFVRAHDNLLYMMHFDERFGPADLMAAHDVWRERHAAKLEDAVRPLPHSGVPSGRRIRVGYVSPDFREHAIGRFMSPLLEHHDRSRFEVFCYASFHGVPDGVTARLRGFAEVWRDIFPLSDDAAADLIRADGIDVLVDLSMHMGGNRMMLFARRPAPVQVTYLAYAGSTGLRNVCCRLSDPYIDPPGEERWYSERTLRLPRTYWCYEPIVQREVGPLPARDKGCVTFGCLNNFNKISPPARRVWSEVLRGVPGSRLLLHAGEGSHRDRLRAEMEAAGVSGERVEFVNYAPLRGYFDLYDRIDIALDPFPYAGGTTTCDALWMGVPVVTLAGRTAVGRGGVSILSNIGLPELVARNDAEYVRIATELAGDVSRLETLRASMRERLRASALMDAPGFARDVEAALVAAVAGR